VTARGLTLLELLVVLAIMGLLAGISGIAIASLRVPHPDLRAEALARAHARAITDGSAVTVPADSAHAALLFLPDGRAVGTGADPLTGEVARAAR
jgi:prepilin-type N-terminal cleavage/methylation domain-containing protein